MIARARQRANISLAKLGIFLLRKSGLFSSYFDGWRWAVFDTAEEHGIHVLPVHYYSPIPNSKLINIDEENPRFFAADAETLDAAVRDIEDICRRYSQEFSEIGARPDFRDTEEITQFRFGRAPYSTVEAEVLYGLIRTRRPNRICEIGCGYTTLLISEAIRAEASDGYSPTFECIEPYRPPYLREPPPEVTLFRDAPLQSVALENFSNLKSGDILFIDSSHVVNYGSDVVYELLEILPQLNEGVLVHFHDIFLPYEYPTQWITDSKFFWSEQYMLSAMVQDNPRYVVKYPLHQLCRQRSDDMHRLFPLLGQSGQPQQGPGAFWLEIARPRVEKTST